MTAQRLRQFLGEWTPEWVKQLTRHRDLGTCFATGVSALAVGSSLLIKWQDGNGTFAAMGGGALGWIVGVLMSPYPREEKQFERLSKGLAGVIAGSAGVKLWDAASKLSKEEIRNQEVLRTAAFFVVALMMTTVRVFIARTYSPAEREERRASGK